MRAIAAGVESVVIVTESATSPRAMNATMFDAVPPGQQATRMKPTANPFSSYIACAMARPDSGMTMNCSPVPIATGRGSRARRA